MVDASSCQLIYDLAATPYWPWSLFVCGALIGLSLVWVLFRKKVAEISFRKYPAGIEFIVLLVAVVAGVSIVGNDYWSYYSLRNAERSGTAQMARGIISEFQLSTPANRNVERFKIGNARFEYFKDDGSPGFRGTFDGGRQLQNGLLAEALHVDGTIVRLKICESEGAP